MTKEQYEQWCDFSRRMALRADFGLRHRPSRAWVIEHVEDVLASFADDYASIHSWDYGDDHNYPCDALDDAEFYEKPCFESQITSQVMKNGHYSHWADTDDELESEIQRRSELARVQWSGQWWEPVGCCVRAGLDMATKIGGGIVGFTVGDMRRMYPEGLPKFVTRHYDRSLLIAKAQDGVWL